MAYCTREDVERALTAQLLVQLTDDSDVPAVVDEEVLDGLIADAGEVIEGYLRDRYVLPVDPPSRLLTVIAVDLVVHSLYGRRPETHGEPPKQVTESWRQAFKTLEHIQQGKVTLGATGKAASSPKSAQIRVNKTAEDRVFGDRFLDQYR